MERVKQLLNEEVHGLPERTAMSVDIDTPNYSREDADEKIRQEAAPLTVGSHGEKVDENNKSIVEKRSVIMTGNGADVSSVTTPVAINPLNKESITKRPTLFNQTLANHANDDWDSINENVVNIKKSTDSNINANDDLAYLERYPLKIAGVVS